MKRPFCFIAVFLISGVLAGEYISSVYFLAFFLAAAAAASGVLMLKQKCGAAMLLPAAFVIGLVLAGNAAGGLENEDIQSLGSLRSRAVVERISKNYGGQRITARVKSIEVGDVSIHTDFQAFVYIKDAYAGKSGDIVEFNGVFLPPREKTQEGYDERLYFGIKNIDYKVYTGSLGFTGEREGEIKYLLLRIRDGCMSVYDKIMPPEEAGILKAFIAGDKSYMSGYMLNLFRNAGLSHILAVSGLHVSIFSVTFFWLLNEVLGLDRRKTAGIVTVFVICYTVIVGGSPSCMRAAISSVISLFGIIIFKESDALNSLAIGVLVLVGLNPLVLYDIGFQMSFVASFFIITAFKASESKALAMVFAAVSLFPLTAYYYNEVILTGIISSFLAVPFCGYVVGFGILSGLAGLFSTALAEFFGGVVFVVIKYFEMVSYFADKAGFLKFNPGTPHILGMLCFYAALLFFLFAVKCLRLKFKREK